MHGRGPIWLAIVWVAYAVVFFGTLIKRKVKHIYVGNWFFGSFILTTAMLHIVNHMSLPVSWFKSYSMYSGATDAMVQWWYGHNAVGFFLTTVAGQQRLAGVRLVLVAVALGEVEPAQRDGVHAEPHRQFVHRAFQPDQPQRRAGGAHVQRGIDVQRHQTVGQGKVLAAIEHAAPLHHGPRGSARASAPPATTTAPAMASASRSATARRRRHCRAARRWKVRWPSAARPARSRSRRTAAPCNWRSRPAARAPACKASAPAAWCRGNCAWGRGPCRPWPPSAIRRRRCAARRWRYSAGSATSRPWPNWPGWPAPMSTRRYAGRPPAPSA